MPNIPSRFAIYALAFGLVMALVGIVNTLFWLGHCLH